MDTRELAEINKDKNTPILDVYDSLRVIYGDILRGHSFYKPENIYIKHFDDLDNIEIARKKEGLMEAFLQEGVPTEKERLQIVNESGEWTKDDDESVAQLEFNISDNTQVLKTINIPSQQEHLRSLIKGWEDELVKKRAEKFGILGVTAEHRAAKITNNYFIYYAFHKDPEFKEKFWTEQDFQEMDEHELVRYIKIYNKSLYHFSERTFRKISCLPFVLNFASYCKDQGMFFYGKPITSFTNYQMAIYTRAMRNTFVLREAKGTPPQINTICTVQEILDWYDSQYAIIISGNDPSTHGQVKERQGKGGIRRSIKM